MTNYFPFTAGGVSSDSFNQSLGYAPGIIEEQHYVTDTMGSTTFSGSSVKFLMVRNNGPDYVYISFDSTIGSNEGVPLAEADSFTFNCGGAGETAFYFQCATGSTGSIALIGNY